MCGVPVHAADDYLQKLIGLGFRVAVCEQIEDPAEAKKRGAKSVVKRDVVRLVTPGTITEDKLLAPSESSFLMALGAGQRRRGSQGSYALAWIEMSTGVFRVAETDADRLARRHLPHRPARADRRRAGVPRSRAEAAVRPCSAASPARSRPALFDSAPRPDRIAPLLRRRDARQFRRFRPRRTVGDRRHRRLCREDPEGRAAAAVASRSASRPARRCSSTRRRAPISNCCARCRAAATARCSRRSTAP